MDEVLARIARVVDTDRADESRHCRSCDSPTTVTAEEDRGGAVRVTIVCPSCRNSASPTRSGSPARSVRR